MAARAKKVAVIPLNGDVFPVSDGPALQFVALDVIDMNKQVRTEFDEATIAELAADVKANGMLQPVLLRRVGERFGLIAGERRVRAARIAGLSSVPALVGDASDDQVSDMQLAENIQREALSLTDEAQAVRALYDRLGKVDAVASRVRKSKAWVSKRLAFTYPGFAAVALALLEDGVTEDMELLQCVSKVFEFNSVQAFGLAGAIRGGDAGRKEARAVLAKVKKTAQAESAVKSGTPVRAKVSKVAAAKQLDARRTLFDLVAELRDPNSSRSVADIVAGFDDAAQIAILDICVHAYESGVACVGQEPLALVRRLGVMNASYQFEDWSVAAFTLGAFGLSYELGTLLAEIQIAVRN